MAKQIVLSQRTSRHTVKKLTEFYTYLNSFGTWESAKNDNTGLNFPCGIAIDSLKNLYICDSKNSRIVKLDSSLNFVNYLDVSTTIGKPYAIIFDPSNSDLYVSGIYDNFKVSIARITTSLSILRSNHNIYQNTKDKVYGISKGFNTNEFLIVLGNLIISITEDLMSNDFVTSTNIINETIIATSVDAVNNRTSFTLQHFPVTPTSYTFFRTWTETPEKLTASTFQTTKFPILGIPDIDFKVFINTVGLDYNPLLNTTNDYDINQTTGLITLSQPLEPNQTVLIRYKFQMEEITDYRLTINNGALLLNNPVTDQPVYLSDNITTDKIELDYNYSNIGLSQTIVGEETSFFTGIIKHSTTNTLFLTVNKDNVGKIINVMSTYANIGDSNKISKSVSGICESSDGTLLIYDNDNQKIVRFNVYLNKIEDVYIDTSDSIETDAYDVCGILEANF